MTNGDTPELIGRAPHLHSLRDAVARARHGDGSCVVVVGDAGAGKSSLLDAVLTQVQQEDAEGEGWSILTASGVQAEAQLPYAALHSVLRPVMERTATLPAGQRSALRAAFGMEDAAGSEPFLIALAALSALSDEAANRPVLLVIDDAHWLDRPSQDVIGFLARRVGREKIALILATRPGEPNFAQQSGVTVLAVDPLDEDQARTLLDRTGPGLSHTDRQHILEEAAGIPLALVELPSLWTTHPGGDRLPRPGGVPLNDRLEQSFVYRLQDLPDHTRDALLVAAIDSENRTPEILAATSRMASTQLNISVLDPAQEAGLIRYDESRLQFRHPLVRSGIVQREPAARVQDAHRALAEILDDEPYRQAWHRAYSVIGPDDGIADDLERAHTESLRRGSAPAAIAALERSAELTQNPQVKGRRLLLAAEHAFGLGRADLVDRLVSTAAGLPLTDLDRGRMEWLSEIFNDGVPGDGARIFELGELAAAAADSGDTDLALNLLMGAALRCWWAEPGERARRHVVEVTRRLSHAEHDPRYTAILAVADPLHSAATAKHLYDDVVLETLTDANQLRLYGMAAHAVSDPEAVVDFLSRAESRLREQGRLAMLSHAVTMQILNHIELGNWDQAVTCSAEGLLLAQESGQPVWDTGTHSLKAIVEALRSNHEESEAIAARAELEANGRRLSDLLACVLMARGFAALTDGRPSDALDLLLRVFDEHDIAYHPTERFHAVAYLAEAAVRSGRQDEIRHVMHVLEAEAAVTPSPTLHVHLDYAHAVLEPDSRAETSYRKALAAVPIRWSLARARLELAFGAWLRRQRRVAESRGMLRSAAATLTSIGADYWSEQARNELRAAGERLTEAPAAGVETLSAQELQIARLAAQGLSNREIGARLFLSPRTVGSHLYRIFPKLGVSSRAQLAARLQQA